MFATQQEWETTTEPATCQVIVVQFVTLGTLTTSGTLLIAEHTLTAQPTPALHL
jgi:hypothetical protein